MVSGIGPKEVLDAHGIVVLANRPGVGQNMWVRETLGRLFETYRESLYIRANTDLVLALTR